MKDIEFMRRFAELTKQIEPHEAIAAAQWMLDYSIGTAALEDRDVYTAVQAGKRRYRARSPYHLAVRVVKLWHKETAHVKSRPFSGAAVRLARAVATSRHLDRTVLTTKEKS